MILQFCVPEKGQRLGIVDGDKVFDITSDRVSNTMQLIEMSISQDVPIEQLISDLKPVESYSYSELDISPDKSKPHLILPIDPPEVWGCGVTYEPSAMRRDEDTDKQRGIYTYVYSAERPEIFFKATASRCSGPNEYICIRSDSNLTAAEAELAYVLRKGKEIIGYTICNDVSAWDIERENPLYLPQSKIFYGCCALGPVIALTSEIRDPYNLNIKCRIMRNGTCIFYGESNTSKMRRTFDELAEFITRDNPIPPGTVVATGTGIMVPNEYALADRDVVEIEIEGIGKLSNPVKKL